LEKSQKEFPWKKHKQLRQIYGKSCMQLHFFLTLSSGIHHGSRSRRGSNIIIKWMNGAVLRERFIEWLKIGVVLRRYNLQIVRRKNFLSMSGMKDAPFEGEIL